ncbi:MAG: hypothetical protein KDD15_11135, partial [Lewinella sp.]|nr:hypothetical protein [Lewinella sp.]
MLKSLLSTTLFLLTGITLVGQSPTPQQMIDEFFSIYESGKPVEAIEYLYSSNSQEWLDMIQADIDNVKNRF